MLWPWSSIWDENFRQHAKRSHTLVATPPVPVLLLSLLSSGNRSPVSSRDSCWICGTKVSSFTEILSLIRKAKMDIYFKCVVLENISPRPCVGHFCFGASIQPGIFISAGECCTPSPSHPGKSVIFSPGWLPLKDHFAENAVALYFYTKLRCPICKNCT